MNIDWTARWRNAHKACPCICQDQDGCRHCIRPNGTIDACYTCQQFHIEVDEIIEEGKRVENQ